MNSSNDSTSDNITAFPGTDANSHKIKLIKEQAASYLVQIDSGECTAEERQQIATWARANPQHQAAFVKLAKQWDSMAILADLSELFPLAEKERTDAEAYSDAATSHTANAGNNAGSTGNKESSWFGLPLPSMLQGWVGAQQWRLQGIAVGAVFAMALAVVALPSVRTMLFSDATPSYITAIGERATYTLDDGSVLTLNTDTEVTVRFTEQRRFIDLLRGEANFEVAKNTQRPFVVYAGEGLVWAVGTAFNVRYQPETFAVDVVVTEGTVKVFTDVNLQAELPALTVDPQSLQSLSTQSHSTVHLTNNKQSLLTAGQHLRYREAIEVKQVVDAEQLQQQLAWHNGVIIFDGETLESALSEIGRYTSKQLVIVDDSIRSIRIGGHYKTNDLNGFLATLTSGFGVHVEPAGKNRLLLSAASVSSEP